MNKEPKISIIIPVYNVEPYIAECVESVMRQTYQGEIECILVDDCGRDNSIAVAEKIIADYQGPVTFRIFHHEHNRGLSAARNTGTDAATGDYIYYLDSDDYISDDCIEVLTQPLQKFEYDMVIGDILTFQTSAPRHLLKRETGAILSKEDIVKGFYVEGTLYDAACNKLWKKSLSQHHDLTFLVGQLHEDDLWMYKCCECMQTMYIQNQTTYYYRMTEGSIMHTRTRNYDKTVQSIFTTAEYVLSHPLLINQHIWNQVMAQNLWTFVSVISINNTYEQLYISLRERFNYQPLAAFMTGKFSWKQFKHQIHLLLPPSMGFKYLRARFALRKLLKG